MRGLETTREFQVLHIFYSQTAMEFLRSIPEVRRKRRHARAHGASFPGPFAGHQ